MLIWDAMSNHLRENLEAGRSVNVPGFGVFTFEPITHDDPMSGKTRVQLRPCFIINGAIKASLYNYPGKEEIRASPNGSSVYQLARKVIFMNEVPIAAGCYYKTDLIKSALKALFSGIADLVKRSFDLKLDFNGVQVLVMNRNLTVKFHRELTQTVQSTTARPKSVPVSATWRSAKLSTSMMNFIERPNSPDVVATRNRTANLSILSLDMNSCVKTPRAYSSRCHKEVSSCLKTPRMVSAR